MSTAIEADADLKSALNELLALAGMPVSTPLTTQDVKAAIENLKAQLSALSADAHKPQGKPSDIIDASVPDKMTAQPGANGRHKKILLVGQLGIVLHQIKQILSPLDAQITLAKNIENAVVCYQQEHPSLIVIDLLMPSKREGMALLQAIRQLSRQANIQPEPEIIILNSSSNDEQVNEACHAQGANHDLDKHDKWQQGILDLCR